MKLHELVIENFRQFSGQVRIEFAHEGTQPVTVIHGTNGAGKTTILNSFTWGLYGEFTPAFSEPGELLNRKTVAQAEKGASLATKVTIVFEHEGKRYEVCRTRIHKKDNGEIASVVGSDELSVAITDERGETKIAKNPDRVINLILPKHLYAYFFFDGERIENIVRQDKDQRKDIARATKSLMGVEVLDRAVRHLRGDRGRKGVRRELEDELERLGDPDTNELLAKQHRLEDERATCSERAQTIEEEVSACIDEIHAIDDRLRELKPAAELQQKRDELQNQYETNKGLLEHVEKELRRIVGTKAHVAFLRPSAGACSEVLESLRTKGELPSGLKRHFVDGLLEKSLCICDRDISSGTPERVAVEQWRDRAGLADVEQRALRLSSSIEELELRIGEFEADLDDSMKRRGELQEEQDRIDADLREISEGLASVPEEDIGQLEKKRSEIELRRGGLNRELGGEQQKERDLGIEIGGLEREIERLRATEERQRVAQRRLKACGEAIDVLEDVQESLVETVRVGLQTRIQKLFKSISFKPYRPQLNKDYTLRLVQTVGGQELPVAASAGENQILSLSFIGSIVATAGEKRSKLESTPLQGPAVYPIVMDSPFGTLDSEYRQKIAHHIPELAPQIIVLVSQTQWRGEVEKEMTPRAGKQYVLVYHGEPEGTADREVTINGRTYALVRPSDDGFEMTDVQEVE